MCEWRCKFHCFLQAQAPVCMAAAVGSWGHGKHISGCPRASGQPQICLPWAHHYEVVMVEAGAKKRYVLHSWTPVARWNHKWFLGFEFSPHVQDWILASYRIILAFALHFWLSVGGCQEHQKHCDRGPKLFLISIVQGLRLRCPAVAGREGMETQSSLWCIPHVICHSEDWVSICSLPWRQKERWGSFRWFQLRPCQGRLAQPVGRNRLVAAVVLHKGTSA